MAMGALAELLADPGQPMAMIDLDRPPPSLAEQPTRRSVPCTSGSTAPAASPRMRCGGSNSSPVTWRALEVSIAADLSLRDGARWCPRASAGLASVQAARHRHLET